MALILDETFANGIPTKSSDIDPYANYVTSYIPFVSYDGTTMPDLAPSRSWTNNNVSISTAQTKYLPTSGSFTGATNSYYAHAYNVDFDFGTSDFTVEAWIYLTADSPAGGDGNKIANIFGLNTATPSTTYWQFLLTGDSSSTGTGLAFYISDAGTTVGRSKTVTITKNAWHHIAVSKNSLGVYLCLDGVLYPTDPIAVNVNNGSNGLTIGNGTLTSTYERPFTGYISEARITKGYARYTPNNQALTYTAYGDTDYRFTSLLCHFNGTNGSTTFTDNSYTPKTGYTTTGSPVISTTQSKFGGSSLYLDGSSNIDFPANTDYDFGSADFCIEFWFRPAAVNTDQQIIYYGNAAVSTGTDVSFGIMITGATSKISGWYYNSTSQYGIINSGTVLTANNWYHVVYVRSINAQYLYVNGKLDGSQTSSNVNPNTPSSRILRIGTYSTGTPRRFTGYIDDLRITKGKVRYPFMSFQLENTPYADSGVISYTSSYTSTESTNQVGSIVTNSSSAGPSILLHGNGTNGSTTFIDSSLNGATSSASQYASISTTQSKFGGSSIFIDAPSAYAGSNWAGINYPASNNYNFGNGEFTIEGWVYPTYFGMNQSILSYTDDNATTYDTFGWQIYIVGGAGTLSFRAGNADATGNYEFGGSTVLNINAWNHFAVVRSGTTVSIYVNGSLDTSITWGWNFVVPATPNLRVGYRQTNWVPYSLYAGYLDDLRITKGVALYTSSFSVPTSAYTDPTPSFNLVSSHLSFNGANNSTTFTDQAGNTWSSIGTPQIKTAESKFGGASGYFSVGNYLSLANSSKFDLGTTPFTVECWFKPSDLTAVVSTLMPLITAGRIDVNSTGGGWSLYATVLPGSYDARFAFARYGTDGTTIKAESEYITTLNTSTWYHICATRDDSGFVDLYLNGSRIARSGEFSGISLTVPNSNTITIGTSGTVASAALYPYVGYIDELRVVKGIATYKDEFSVPTAAYAYTTETQYKYTQPYRKLGTVGSYTFATATFASVGLTVSANSTYKSADFSNTTTAIWDITSIINAMSSGEIELDFEIITDSSNNRYFGIGLVNANAASSGFGHIVRNSTSQIQLVNSPTTWSLTVTSTLFSSDGNTLSAANLNKRKVFTLRWDYYSPAIQSNIELLVDGVMVYSGNTSILNQYSRPGIYGFNTLSRIHAIRVWDRPTKTLRSASSSNFIVDSGVQAQNRLVIPLSAPAPATLPTNLGEKSFTLGVSDYNLNAVRIPESVLGYRDGPQGVYGTGYISGTIKRSALPSNIAVLTQLYLVEESSQTTVAKKYSDNSGNYKFEGLQTSLKYTVYAWDPIRSSRAVILDNVYPKNQVDLTQNIGVSLTGNSTTTYLTTLFDTQYDSLLTASNVVAVYHGDQPTDFSSYRRTLTTKGGGKTTDIPYGSNITGLRGKTRAYQLSVNTNQTFYTPYNSNFDFGTSDWYVEFNVMVPVLPTSSCYVFTYGYDGSTIGGIYVSLGTNGSYVLAYTHTNASFASYSSAASAFTTNTWYNVCITRVGNYVYGYWNRNLVLITTAGNISTGLASRGYSIGSNTAGGTLATSIVYVDDLIMVKGIGRPGASSYAIPYTAYQENTTADAYYSNVTLLLHGVGTNGSTTFTDNSSYNRSTTAVNTTISNSQSKFGGTSMYFAGGSNTSGLEYSDSTDWQFGTSDFTIEFWIYGNTNVSQTGLFAYSKNDGSSNNFSIRCDLRFNAIDFYIVRLPDGTAAAFSSSGSLTVNSWNHVAITRVYSTGALYIHINGTNVYQTTGSAYSGANIYVPGSQTMKLGRFDNSGNLPVFVGYLDDFRITKGTARYPTASSITVPAAAFENTGTAITVDPYWSNTSLLCHFEGANGSTSLTDTKNSSTLVLGGATQLVTSDYAVGTSSLYFDGTDINNGLTISGNSSMIMGTSDFTIEFWIKPLITYGNVQRNILCTSLSASLVSTTDFCAYLYSGTLNVYMGNGQITTQTALTLNTWQHIVIQRTSTYMTIWIDGKINVYNNLAALLTANVTNAIAYVGNHRSGFGTSTSNFVGYIDELRITKAARYGSTMTTLNGNATTRKFDILTDNLYGMNEIFYHGDSLVDVTGKNRVTYNYGGASVDNSTLTVTGYSTLKLPIGGYIGVDASSSPISIGSSDFTVEFYANWAGSQTVGTKGVISFVQNNTLTSNLFKLSAMIESAGGGVTYYLNGNNCTRFIANTGIPPRTWHHVAIVRYSGITTIYINGVSVGSAADVTTYAVTSYVAIGSGSYTNYGSDTLAGNIAELRISKLARYTAAFTPEIYRLVDTYPSSISISGVSSTSQIGQITQDPYYDNVTFRLTFDEDGFFPRDSSKYQLGAGVLNTSLYSSSPYKTSTGAVYGGALKVPTAPSFTFSYNDYNWTPPAGFAFGTGQFTIEGWIKVENTTYNGVETLISFTGMSPNVMAIGTGMYFGRLSDSNSYWLGTNGLVGVGGWYHLALTRDSSNTVRSFLNGTLQRTIANDTNNWTQPSSISIASSNNQIMVDDIRITKGVARYTSNFTPSRIML